MFILIQPYSSPSPSLSPSLCLPLSPSSWFVLHGIIRSFQTICWFNSEVTDNTVFIISPVLYPKWVVENFLNTFYSLKYMLLLMKVSPQRISPLSTTNPIFIYNWNGGLSFRSFSNVIAIMMDFQIILKRLVMLTHLKLLAVYLSFFVASKYLFCSLEFKDSLNSFWD